MSEDYHVLKRQRDEIEERQRKKMVADLREQMKDESRANFTLVLRAYDAGITGAAPNEMERWLVDGEIEPAQQLLSMFNAELTVKRDAESEPNRVR